MDLDRYPVVPGRVRRAFPRPPPAVVEGFADIPIADLSDAVGRMYTADHTIRPLYEGAPRLLGAALTVKCPAGDNYGVKAALTLSEPGDVLVIDGQGFTEWCLGGFRMLHSAITDRGLRGVLVNGAYRDAEDFRAASLPLYGMALAPWSGPKRGPAEINVPIACGGVVVEPGDVVIADRDGTVVIPRHGLDAVLAHLARRVHAAPADLDARRVERFWSEFASRGGVILDGNEPEGPNVRSAP